MRETECPMCSNEAPFQEVQRGAEPFVAFCCPDCGPYLIAGRMSAAAQNTIAAIRSSESWLRFELRKKVSQHPSDPQDISSFLTIEPAWLERPAEGGLRKRNVSERQNGLLRAIGERIGAVGGWLALGGLTPFVLGAYDDDDVSGLFGLLEERGFVKEEGALGGLSCQLSAAGWDAFEALERGSDGNQVFVAMSFDPALHEVYDVGMEPVIQSLGLNPMILRKKLHNNRIDAEIEAEIRKSALVIADVTQNKAGVYYEAGLARGWGIPVIWTVREDELKGVHFDTRQFLHIVWTTPANLAEQLRAHIDNTFMAERRARGR